jgi:hypothetical protein
VNAKIAEKFTMQVGREDTRLRTVEAQHNEVDDKWITDATRVVGRNEWTMIKYGEMAKDRDQKGL